MRIIRPATLDPAALVSNVPENDYAAWSATTTYATAGESDRVIVAATHKIYEPVKVSSTSAVTVDAGTNKITWAGHGLSNGTKLTLTYTTQPSPLALSTTYYVINATTDDFQVAASAGGAVIDITAAGSGVIVTAQSNYNRDPTLAANQAGATPFWREVSATNKYKMFDTSSTSTTELANEIVVTLTPGRANSLSLVGLVGNEVQVTSVVDGVTKYDQTFDLRYRRTTGLYSYFFEPILRKTKLVITDMPPYAAATVTIKVKNPGSTAKCGGVQIGMLFEFGETLWMPESRFLDYSTKETDRWGNTKLEPGLTVDTLSAEVFVENYLFDEVKRLMKSYAGTALTFIGNEDFSSTILYAFCRDFRGVIDSPAGSYCNFDLEELA